MQNLSKIAHFPLALPVASPMRKRRAGTRELTSVPQNGRHSYVAASEGNPIRARGIKLTLGSVFLPNLNLCGWIGNS
jgi:hypothetical protein